MKIKTSISFVWDTDNENEDSTEKTFEEWAKYFKELMVSDIENFVKYDEVMAAIEAEEVTA